MPLDSPLGRWYCLHLESKFVVSGLKFLTVSDDLIFPKLLFLDCISPLFIIIVHSADNTRMELIIPGEQHFYMKAVNAAERQRWLVALGSSKACLTDTRTKKEKGNYTFFLHGGNIF